MAVKIRLARFGTRNKPYFRIVVADKESPRDGSHLEVVGQYDPKKGIEKANLKSDRIQHWLKNGAQPSGIVRQILKKAKAASKAA